MPMLQGALSSPWCGYGDVGLVGGWWAGIGVGGSWLAEWDIAETAINDLDHGVRVRLAFGMFTVFSQSWLKFVFNRSIHKLHTSKYMHTF